MPEAASTICVPWFQQSQEKTGQTTLIFSLSLGKVYIMHFISLVTTRLFGTFVASDWIDGANVIVTGILGVITAILAKKTYSLSEKQADFSKETKAEEERLAAEQDELQKRQAQLESNQNSLILHNDVFDKLIELNKIEILDPQLFIYISKNHDKKYFVVPPSKYSEYQVSHQYEARNETLNAKACGFLYLQINIFDMYFLYRDTESKYRVTGHNPYGRIRNNEHGPADSTAWNEYTKNVMSRNMYFSFYIITEDEWGQPLRNFMSTIKQQKSDMNNNS